MYPRYGQAQILVHLVLFGAILVLFGARAALKASTLVVPWLAAAARMALGATVLALAVVVGSKD